jgi:hypothetical protein
MAFSSGVYTGVANSFNNAAEGDVIDPDDWNTLFTDIETALNVLSKGTYAAKTDLAAATTTNLGSISTLIIRITGNSVTITSFGTTGSCLKLVYFSDVNTLTHNATTLILPGGFNRTTAAGDCGIFVSDESGNWRCWLYVPASGSVFLPSGGVVNFNAGDVNITHSANTLTFTGASSGYVYDSTVSTSVLLRSYNATATPAAAAAVAGVAFGTALVGVYWGTGSPNTALTAPKGSLYLRTDGSTTNDRIYVNTDASTAWTNVTTAG